MNLGSATPSLKDPPPPEPSLRPSVVISCSMHQVYYKILRVEPNHTDVRRRKKKATKCLVVLCCDDGMPPPPTAAAAAAAAAASVPKAPLLLLRPAVSKSARHNLAGAE